MTGMTKLWLENLQAVFSYYLEQFGDENGGQAHDTGMDKTVAAAISAQSVKCPRLIKNVIHVLCVHWKKCCVH